MMANDAGSLNWEELRKKIIDINNSKLGKSLISLRGLRRDDPTRMLLQRDGRYTARWTDGGALTESYQTDFAKVPVHVGLDLSSKEDLSALVIHSREHVTPVEIVESIYMTKTVEDWSDCRSPSRAKRRMKRGFPQRMRHREVPRTDIMVIDNRYVMHPDTARRLRERIRQSTDKMDEDLHAQLLGVKF